MDGLSQILHELAPVVLVPRVERDQHFAVDVGRQADAVLVVCVQSTNNGDSVTTITMTTSA